MSRFVTGEQIGPYRIDGVLGEGGMGVVYRAIDARLSRAVAVKVLSTDAATPAEYRHFQREAQTASSLNHPHIVSVFDAGEFDGRQYLVTELADGGTLAEWMRAGTRGWRDVVELLVGVADALATAHDAGILHRDIKPDNVLLTRSGYAKLADFGLARASVDANDATQSIARGLTAHGSIVGTAAYMSPEQTSGSPIDARSDVFSFGILLSEALTGMRPFAGATAVDVWHAIIHDAPAPLPEALPAALRIAVAKALEKHPADRYQSMRDLVVDLRRVLRHSGEMDAPPPPHPAGWMRAGIAAAAIVLAASAAAAWFWLRPPPRSVAARVEFTPLTNFADSVVAPALSRDGRILAFIRGENTFDGPGEIYVKMLPDGEPSALTHDGTSKMGPLVFSPDGSRVAYTVGAHEAWSVPLLGGEPARLLSNAGAMSWVTPPNAPVRRVLFSRIIDGIHMGLFTAAENRSEERPVYVPADVNGMAHRSALSPDGKSTIVVEMDMLGWRPCRVVPFDGSGTGVVVGPPRSQCTDAAWSPDGAWIYLSANTGAGFHIWRQRFPGGVPEQVTSGATEEQGIAFDPDGQSFLTSVGEMQSTLWVHTGGATRQVTFEGFAYLPSFSADGTRLYYLQRTKADRRFVSGELWTMDLTTNKRERLLADTLMEHYDVSRDGRRVAYIAIDASGRSSIWEAAVDGGSPPKRLSPFEGLRVLFGPHDTVFFVGGETTSLYLYALGRDGVARRVIDTPSNFLYDISPDGQWVAAWVGASVAFYPVTGGAPVMLCAFCGTAGDENRGVTPALVRWSKDGRSLYLFGPGSRNTFVAALPAGRTVPDLPPGGVSGMGDVVARLGANPIPDPRAFVGPDPSVYAFPRVVVHRNIYRIKAP